MNFVESRLVEIGTQVSALGQGVRVGHVVGQSMQGEPIVDYVGNPAGPRVARIAVPCAATGATAPAAGAEVLLVFDSGDRTRPIILGMMSLPPDAAAAAPRREPALRELHADHLDLQGRDQVTLRCGKSSLTLFADGRIVLKGTRLTSRASESNKIKGGVIALN